MDLDVASTTNLITSTVKDNIFGVLGSVIVDLLLVGILAFSISLIWQVGRGLIKGK